MTLMYNITHTAVFNIFENIHVFDCFYFKNLSSLYFNVFATPSELLTVQWEQIELCKFFRKMEHKSETLTKFAKVFKMKIKFTFHLLFR